MPKLTYHDSAPTTLLRAKDSKTGQKIFTYRGTTERVDSHDSVILRDGIDMKAFRSNPVVTSAHSVLPEDILGRSPKQTKIATPKGIDFEVTFHDKTEKAEQAERMAEANLLRGASIAFIPKQVRSGEEISPEERVKRQLGPFGWIVAKSELRALGLTAVPSNPDTVKRAIQTRTILEEDVPDLVSVWGMRGLPADFTGVEEPDDDTEGRQLPGDLAEHITEILTGVRGISGLDERMSDLEDALLAALEERTSLVLSCLARLENAVQGRTGTTNGNPEAADASADGELEKVQESLQDTTARVLAVARGLRDGGATTTADT